MENASKFIQIAGGILLALIVITLIVIGYRNITDMQRANEKSTIEYQLGEFNKKFESYNKSVVRGYEMISLTNMALDNNERYSEADNYKPIKIWVTLRNTNASMPGADGTNGLSKLSNKNPDGKKNKNKDYYDMIRYVTEYYSVLEEHEDKSNAESHRNEFKSMYFECTDIAYDKNTGRVTALFFDQIIKMDDK